MKWVKHIGTRTDAIDTDGSRRQRHRLGNAWQRSTNKGSCDKRLEHGRNASNPYLARVALMASSCCNPMQALFHLAQCDAFLGFIVLGDPQGEDAAEGRNPQGDQTGRQRIDAANHLLELGISQIQRLRQG